jgi:hypothetical protein
MRRLRTPLLSNFAQLAGARSHLVNPGPFGCGRGSRQAGLRAEVSGFQSPDPGFPHDFPKRGRSEKENNMDWNAIFFAVALPLFVFGAIGMGVYVQRLPG